MFPPDARLIRLPVLILATLTVLLYFVLSRMTIGDMGALIAITTVLNSGIDAVQHFLTAGALLLFLTFHRRGDAWMLKAACFLCGLGQPREGMCRFGRTR